MRPQRMSRRSTRRVDETNSSAVSVASAATVMQSKSIGIVCFQVFSEKLQTRSLHDNFQILTCKQHVPRRTTILWDSYKYNLDRFDESSDSVWDKLSGIGHIFSTYSPHAHRADEDFAGHVGTTPPIA